MCLILNKLNDKHEHLNHHILKAEELIVLWDINQHTDNSSRCT